MGTSMMVSVMGLAICSNVLATLLGMSMGSLGVLPTRTFPPP